MYQKDFFELIIKFCDIVSEKNGVDYIQLMTDFTPIKIRLFKNIDKDEAEKDWKRICELVKEDKSAAIDFIYETYLKNKEINSARDLNCNNFGCFHYDYQEDIDAYQLHLDIVDEKGILSKERMPQREKDLVSMFHSIKYHNKPDAKVFVITWLLNIEAFNRLFPAEFVNSAKLTGEEMNANSLWGQFIDRNNQLNKEMVERFIVNLQGEKEKDINMYFPFPCMRAEANVQLFLDFYLP